MKSSEVEEWTLLILGAVSDGHPVEDSRIELKSVWPEPAKAARRLAGHANAARGEEVLWLIGVNEKGASVPGVTVEDEEPSNWYAQVTSNFESAREAPAMLHSRAVRPDESRTVYAMLFSTENPPYLVRNPDPGPVEFEVPWREATGVRTARRSDLARILLPLSRSPKVELLDGSLTGVRKGRNTKVAERSDETCLTLELSLYVTPLGSPVVFPSHDSELSVSFPGILEEAARPRWARKVKLGGVGSMPHRYADTSSEGDLRVTSPSRVRLRHFFAPSGQ